MNFDKHRLTFEVNRLRKLPLPILASKALLKLSGLVLGTALLPVSAFLHFKGYRHVTVFTDRIGHLALEPDCLLKEQALGHLPHRKWIMLAPPGRVANEHLLTYWQTHFLIVRSRAISYLIASMSRWGLMRHNIDHYIRAIGKAQAAYRIYAAWNDRLPLLQLSSEDDEWGRCMLRKLGLPEGAWFVCIHARESGFSPVDEELHSHRNSNIEHALNAIHEIVLRGGWVVRIGDPTMKPLPPMHHLVDYAHHPLKSPRLDIVLCAKARFILGNTSGIALLGTIFGTPCALANMVPITAMGLGLRDISIPKLYWSIEEQRYLTVEEAFFSPVGTSQYGREFEKANIRVDENNPDDIKELAAEMLDRQDELSSYDAEYEILRVSFTSRIQRSHYSFGCISNPGIRFLRRHQALFQADLVASTTVSIRSTPSSVD
jgi:putative glycosyltransferase (TIGR04372 family)